MVSNPEYNPVDKRSFTTDISAFLEPVSFEKRSVVLKNGAFFLGLGTLKDFVTQETSDWDVISKNVAVPESVGDGSRDSDLMLKLKQKRASRSIRKDKGPIETKDVAEEASITARKVRKTK